MKTSTGIKTVKLDSYELNAIRLALKTQYLVMENLPESEDLDMFLTKVTMIRLMAKFIEII